MCLFLALNNVKTSNTGQFISGSVYCIVNLVNMKSMRRLTIRIGALAITGALLLVGFVARSGEQEEKNQVLMQAVMQSLNTGHYSELNLDDAFSQKAYDLYLERLDYGKRFLLQSDVDLMNKYRNKIDDEINNNSSELLNLSAGIIDGRIRETEAWYKEILAQPFDFSKKEIVETDPEKLVFAKTKDELKDRWRQTLKRAVLARVVSELENQEEAKEKNDETVEQKSFEQLEKESREKILKSQNDWFRRLKEQTYNDRLSGYVNAIANIYDPHTGYFPPNDKENFDINMSGQLEGIGATLQEKDEFVSVERIVPGSPSSRQGELQSGDLIMKVAQGKDEPVDIEGMPLDEVVKMIRGKKGTEVRLTVKKIDGKTKVISIIRDVVILEETYAKSALIKREGENKPIGYIKLPKFYADFNQRGGRRCAIDVKEEVEKLSAEGVSGIILDLRNNGGGSLYDVVEMAGLFIDKGPVVQVKSRDARPEILADTDPKVQYDGPLVIMVNSFSASASEIMAAALQDYERAIIVGSPSTFGKGTVQRFFDLDRMISSHYESLKPFGALKLTTQKFYRINGGATQLRGVIPDIILPDAYSYIEVGEKENDYSMPWDEIAPAPFQPYNHTWTVPKLRINSQKRTAQDESFRLISENANRLKALREKTTYDLNFDAYRNEQKKLEAESKKYEDMSKEIKGLVIAPLSMEPAITDTVKQKIQDDWHKELRKDVYLNETLSIIRDMK